VAVTRQRRTVRLKLLVHLPSESRVGSKPGTRPDVLRREQPTGCVRFAVRFVSWAHGYAARMATTHDTSFSRRYGQARAAALGVAAGVAAAIGVLSSRKVATTVKVGQGHALKHRVLDLASGAMQRKYPLEAMNTYLNGFHMYADEMGRQVAASHFCIHLRHDLHQCVIFDRNAPDARLIGIEYIISAERFQSLPADEK